MTFRQPRRHCSAQFLGSTRGHIAAPRQFVNQCVQDFAKPLVLRCLATNGSGITALNQDPESNEFCAKAHPLVGKVCPEHLPGNADTPTLTPYRLSS